jgi:DNA-binding response OmpR family regulator
MLVLLDLKLPRKDGLTVLQEIRQSPLTRRLPVVILTSSRDDADLASGYDRGANSCVRKPVDFTEFVKTLATYWLKINGQPRDRDGGDHDQGTAEVAAHRTPSTMPTSPAPPAARAHSRSDTHRRESAAGA